MEYLNEQRKELNQVRRKCKIYNNAQCTIYMDHPKKLPRGSTQGQGGLSESNPLRSDCSLDGHAGG
jgi:hypothetical protein